MTGGSDTPLGKEARHQGGLRGPGGWSAHRIPGSAAPIPASVEFTSTAKASKQAGARICDGARCARPTARDAGVRDSPQAAVGFLGQKSSKVGTDITEDTIRDLALPLGFVDVKVCAVTEVWSGLKLVVRKELRHGPDELGTAI